MIARRTSGHAAEYQRAGYEAATFVADAAERALHRPPADALDLGCGYGRVLRHLVAMMPETRWTASDIDRDAVKFCARVFGAVPVVSQPRIATADFVTAPYDVIWMGSLLTHLDAGANADILRTLAGLVRDRAVLAFSTHGPALTSRLAEYGTGLEERRDELERVLTVTGFGYLPYQHYVDGSYGVAFHHPDRVDRMVRDAFPGQVERFDLRERAWMEHHDLHAFAIEHRPQAQSWS